MTIMDFVFDFFKRLAILQCILMTFYYMKQTLITFFVLLYITDTISSH